MTIQNRFTIGDPICGLVESASTQFEAFLIAESHAIRCKDVTVYDVMAHKGKPREWTSGGGVLAYRGKA